MIDKEVWEVAAECGAAKSRGQARKLQGGGGLYFNDEKVGSAGRKVGEGDLVGGEVCLVRTGKENYKVVRVV